MPFNQAKERRSMYIFKKCLLARMSWHGILYDLSIFKMFGIKNLTNKLKAKAPPETGKRSPYCVLFL